MHISQGTLSFNQSPSRNIIIPHSWYCNTAKVADFTASTVEQVNSTPRFETDAKSAAFSLLTCSYMLHNDAPCGRKRPNAPPPPRRSVILTPKHHNPNRELFVLHYRTRLTVASPSDSRHRSDLTTRVRRPAHVRRQLQQAPEAPPKAWPRETRTRIGYFPSSQPRGRRQEGQ